MVDGQAVKGTLLFPEKVKSKTPAVLLIHGWTSSEKWYIPRAVAISRLGYICLTFNLRGHGDSEGVLDELSRKDHLKDVLAAYDFLALQKGVDRERIAVIGASYGGYMASLLAGKRKLNRIVLRAPALYPDESIDTPSGKISRGENLKYFSQKASKKNNRALQSLAKFKENLLLVESDKDEVIPKQTIDNYINAVNLKAKFVHKIIKGADHGLGKETSSAKWLNEFIGILEDYFR